MENKVRYRWIPILMAISEVLLTAFVVYWLAGQYKGERTALEKEMKFEFVRAQDQAMDSTIQIILKPLLKDSLGLSDSIQAVSIVSHDLKKENYKVGPGIYKSRPDTEKVIKLDITDSIANESHATASFHITAIPNEEIVLRGVRMIIEMTADSSSGYASRLSSVDFDSTLFLNIASQNLKNNEHKNLGIVWYQDSLSLDSIKSKNKIIFQSDFSDPGMIYEVTNYRPYLFKKIIPQILFGLLLLLLTGSAFIITYRSLRKQMMLNTLRNEFISNISHELKTPVSTVKVALESIQNFGIKNDRKLRDDYLRMASLEMDRLDLLIQKILNQSLLESGQMMVNRERNNLLVIIENIADLMKPKIEEHGGEMKLNIDIEEAWLDLDILYIQGVLINLLDNALKYGGSPPVIEISLRADKHKIYVDIKDNGTGIQEEYHDKVFERFFRVPSNDRHNVKGYGLGLSFASEVMKQHEGYISLSNNPEGGSTFTLIFKKPDEN